MRSCRSIMVPITLKWSMIMFAMSSLPHTVHCQINTAQDPANANALNTIFYFDSNSDCNGPIRELYGFQATIRGSDISTTRLGPKSCSIRLRSTGQFQGTILDIEVKAMNILDCSTKVTIFDGDGSLLTLMSYDCYSNYNMNRRRLFSTGDTATFNMERENTNSFNFDIEIKITPSRGGTIPGYENDFGSGYFFHKFPQTTIVGLIAGFYGVILLICKIIFLVYCCRYRKMNKKWEIQQLATIKTGAVFDNKTQLSSAFSQSVEMKPAKRAASQYSQPKSRRTVARSEDGDSTVLYNNDVFQKKHLVNAETWKAKPRHAKNATLAKEDDDPDHFVERIITSRVKSSNARGKMPPSYEDAISQKSSDYSTDEESQDSSSETSVRKKPLSSEEERSLNTQSESVSESDSNHSGQAARQAHKPRRRYSAEHRLSPSKSNNHSQMPRSQPPQPQMQQASYGAYQAGQFVPVIVGPNQFQPGAMAYPFPPPSYTDQQAGALSRPQVQATEPPVYSYLVRRGYTPMDVHSSSASSVTGGKQPQEPQLRLDSGVEYMRR